MNSMERVLATLKGNQIDRRAICLTLSLYGARLTECDLTEYYNDPRAYVRGQAAVREAIQPDILFGPFSLALEGEVFGSQAQYFDRHAPNLANPAISPEDIDRLQAPDLDTHPRVIYFREAIELLAKEHGQDLPIAAVALNPVDLPIMILGVDGWLQTLLFDEVGRKKILDLTIPYFIQRINALFYAGAAFVIMPSAFVNPSIITSDIAKTFTIPAMREALSQVEGPLLLHSGGAPMAPFLHLFKELPNVVGYVINGQEDLVQARSQIGPSPALLGNIEGSTLFERTPDDIFDECQQILKNRREDPHFIVGSTGPDISFDTPLENIVVIRTAVEAFAEAQRQ